ncbi:hypothetical protein NE686_00710 [Tissierella carlieri]|uniref:Uncharacterized protein n=1 Tax=Tissierella carlieri TaxID=689904 RepID=A0ABT1S552_9FIRM|nr:hypothetical protein [Tissierella carlieri]MCQ4921590.1 hypothetical protein [Tissierella carlieri]
MSVILIEFRGFKEKMSITKQYCGRAKICRYLKIGICVYCNAG